MPTVFAQPLLETVPIANGTLEGHGWEDILPELEGRDGEYSQTIATSGNYGIARWLDGPFDQFEVAAHLHAIGIGGLALFGRWQDNDNWLAAQVEFSGSSATDDWYIKRKLAGTVTTLASTAGPEIEATGQLMGMRWVGDTIEAWYSPTGYTQYETVFGGEPNWELVLTATDTAIPDSGYFAMGMNNGASSLVTAFSGGRFPARRVGCWIIPDYAPTNKHSKYVPA